MKRYFYSDLIEIESLTVELDSLNFSTQEKQHLTLLIDSMFHHTIVDLILSNLIEEEKFIFLDYLKENNHDKIWQLIVKKVDGVEDKIIEAVEEVKKELHEDIKKASLLPKQMGW